MGARVRGRRLWLFTASPYAADGERIAHVSDHPEARSLLTPERLPSDDSQSLH